MKGSCTCGSVVATKVVVLVVVMMVMLAVVEGMGEEEEGGEGAVSSSSSSSSFSSSSSSFTASSSSFPSSEYSSPLRSWRRSTSSSPIAAPLKIDHSSIRFSSSSSHQEVSHLRTTKVFPQPRLPTKERKVGRVLQGSSQNLQKHHRPQEHHQQLSPLTLPSTSSAIDPSRRRNLTSPSAAPLSMAPPSCSQVAETSLECRVRTLDDAFGAKIPREDREGPVLSLSVACNQFLFFQSLITGSTFQGLEDLEELDVQWCKLSNLPAHALKGLRYLKSLTVITHNSDWAALAMDLYKESLPETLESLTLTHNSIWTLPTGVFCGLRALTHLNISRNRIQDISEMRFGDVEDVMDLREMVSLSNMTVSGHNVTFEYYEEDPVEGGNNPLGLRDEDCGQSLRELILDYNDLVRLPARPFSFLRDLRVLSVSYNDLRLISSEAFHGLESLQELYLSNNHIIALQNGTLEECTQLQRLYLNNNSITDLNENLFDHLDQLQVLDLSRNKLTLNKNLDDLFLGLRRLVILDLSHNALSNIRSPLLRDLTALQRLDLSHNFIQVIEARSFAFLSNLYDLDLSFNQLTSIDDGSFIGLAGLSIVELTNNSLNDVHPNSFGFSSNLKEVYMGANGLHSLPSALGNLSFLRKLDVHQNEIISLEPFRFDGLSNLLELDCRQNRIRNLTSASLKGLEYLEVLDLSHNNIWKLSENVFDHTPKLKTLNLRKNVIDEIHGIFAGMESLQVLDLAENNIQMFDYSFLPRQLGTLHLQRNHIKRLGNYFKVHGVLTLEYLDASFNDIQQVGEISLPNTIRKVKLNNNLMTEVLPNTFREKAKVELVDLSMNRLEKVIPNSITVKTSNEDPGLFTELYLSGNPLVCDCEMSWLQARSTGTGRVLLTAETDAGIITSSALRAASVELPAIMAPGRSSSSQRKRTEVGGPSDQIQQRSSVEHDSLGSLGYRRPRVADLITVSCSLPHSRGNSSTTRVLDALPNQFLCPYATHCFALCNCCDFIACDCQMKCPHGCSCYHDDNWSINLVDCSGNGIDHLPDRVPMDATEVYLDGNNLQTLKAHHFIGRHSLLRLYLNNSQVQTIQNRTFHGLTSLKVLHLEGNLIVHLNGFEFSGLQNLKELYLQNNHISFLHNATFAGLKTLEVLHLDNNFLVEFPVWMFKSNTYLSSLSLLNNPWGCSCIFIEALRSYIASNVNVVRNSKDLFCVYEGTGVVGSNMFSPTFQCDANGSGSVTRHNFSQKELPFLAGGLCGGVALLSALVVLAMLFARRRAASATKLGVSTTSSFCQEDDGKIFDAYISYSANDASFVRDVVALKLENGYPSYKLCLHSRDFTENSRLSEFITQSIGFSRRSIVVLSKNYVDNEWKNAIFKKAHVDGLEGRETSVVSIFYDNISESILDPELRALIRKSTKLKWGDRHFWRRLNDALPQKHTHHPSLPLYLGDNLYKASVISPVLPSAVYPPLPSSASVLTGSTGLTTPSDGCPQRSSLLYQDQPTTYKAPPPPRPCQQGSLSASGDYIVMQGKECLGPGCSCSVGDSDFHNAYTYVDGAGDTASIHTYNSLEPFRLRTPSPSPAMLSSAEIVSPRSLEEEEEQAERISLRSSSTQQYVTIDEPIRKSVRASKRKNKRSKEAAAKAARQAGGGDGGVRDDVSCGSIALRSSQTLPDIGDHFTRSSLLQKSVRRRSGSRSHSRNRSLEGRQDTLDCGSMRRKATSKQEDEEGEQEGRVREEDLREESLLQNSFRRSCTTLRSLRNLDATLQNSFRRSSSTLRNPRVGGGREIDHPTSSSIAAANHLPGSFKRSCSSSLVQPSLRSVERYSDYSTDHSGSDRSSGRSFDRTVTSGMPQESSSTSSSAGGPRPLYAGVPGDCSDLSNAEECFV